MPRKRQPKTDWKPLGLDDIPLDDPISEDQAKAILATVQPRPKDWSLVVEAEIIGIVRDRVKLYRLLKGNQLGRPEPGDIRAAMAVLRDTGAAFHNALRNLDVESCALLERKAGAARFQPNESPFNESPLPDIEGRGAQRLRLLLNAVEQSVRWVDIALSEVPASKRGSKGNPALIWFIGALAGIYTAFTGCTLSRSYKSYAGPFVRTVVAIAEPEAGPGQIDEAMKSVIRSASK